MLEFDRMADELNWDENKRMIKRRSLGRALVLQFNTYYGTDVDDINAWQALCEVLRVYPIPEDIGTCRKVCATTCLWLF